MADRWLNPAQVRPHAVILDASGMKTLSLSDYPVEAWRLLLGDRGSDGDIEALYERASVLYAAVMLRAKALAGLPWRVRTPRGAVRPVDALALTDMLMCAEIDYLLHGAAYWLRDPSAPLGLRRMHPRTVRIDADARAGLRGFVRVIGQTETRLEPDQVVWCWEPSASHEIGPGAAPAMRALAAARYALAQEQYLAAFFERGAVRPTVWMFKTPPAAAEVERFRGWLERLVSGVRNAFRQVALSQEVEAVTLGDKLSDIIAPEALSQASEQILTALNVPHSLVLQGAANYATAMRDWQTFMLVTILPHARRIAATLTERHFARDNLIIEVVEESIEAVQDAELAKAEALARVTGSIMTVNEARARLDLPPMEPDETERVRLQVRQQLEIVRLALDAGLALDQALALAGLDRAVSSSPPTPAPAPPSSAPGAAPSGGAEARAREAETRDRAPVRAWEFPDETKAVNDDVAGELLDEERALFRALVDVFAQHRDAVARAVADDAAPDLDALDADLRATLVAGMHDVAYNAAVGWMDKIGLSTDPARISATLMDWSARRTLEATGPIGKTTRGLLEQIVAQWRATPGADRDALVQMLTPVFGKRRAETIAITAATEAAAQGVTAYQRTLAEEFGLEYERVWLTSNDERVCPICGAYADAREAAWRDQFPDGPPAHPRCRCRIALEPARRRRP